MTPQQVKDQIDLEITNKTSSNSIDPVMVGTNIKNVVDLIDNRNYKKYVAILNRTITGLNIAAVLENEIGTISLQSTNLDIYQLISVDSKFTLNKTVIFANFSDANHPVAKVYHIGLTNTIGISLSPNGGSGLPNDVYKMFIEIRVYN